ncbi:MAG: coiled-coil domain-containing protein [Candidatus Saccharimonadales bacterium]
MKQTSRFFTSIISLVIIVGSLFAISQRQQIFDWWALRNYTPSERIVGLANDTTMNDATRRLFYVNHPELNDKDTFRNKCPATEQSIVLGCYVQRTGIYLLDVTDERLSGVIQVTAAHETLHAQYDRLSSEERARVDTMTSSFFAGLQNDRLTKTIEQYRAKDPSVVPNELHSILATEIKDLSPELEAYYSRYFTNRAQIVAFSEKYEDTFVKLTEQVEQYDARLAALKETIASNQLEIEAQNTEIEQQKQRLDSLINDNSTNQYNAAVPGYNALVNAYNRLIASTRASINEYNTIVEQRNAIATTEEELVEAINSNAMPRKTQ